MANGQTPIDDRVTVRLGKVSKELAKAVKKTGQRESELIRTALAHFFAAHPKPEDIIAAVVAARLKEAAQ
jgi:hypothetical protein